MQLSEQPVPAAQPAAQARQIIRAVEEVYNPPTAYRDDTPLPAVGTTPPVAQPGRPPMSQRATDVSALMLAGGVASLPVGAATSLVLWSLGQVDPVNLAIGAGAPVVLVLAIGRLIGHIKATVEAAPPTIHQHYTGTVHQDSRTVTSTTRGVIANNRNQLPS